MALLLALIIWIIAIVTVWGFIGGPWQLPEGITAHSGAVDHQYFITIVVVGIVFFLAQFTLGYFIMRYRSRGGSERAVYSHGNTKFEVTMTLLTAVVFISLGIAGQRVWAEMRFRDAPPNSVEIEVTGQQFAWNFRYPGPDGRFGRTSPKLMDASTGNPLGVDDTDPAAKDDLVVPTLAIPLNHPVRLLLRAKDVTHSFASPNLRLKQDAVPGMIIPIHFTAIKAGRYEIACMELCGLGHFKMKTFLDVMPEQDYKNWLKQQAGQ